MIRGRIILGFPDADGRSRISVENEEGKSFIGTVEFRQSRYFPVDHNGFPVPGTFKTKREAAAALKDGYYL